MRYDLLHPKALRAALIEHMGPEYPVPQERQVRRWISGDNAWPGWARKAVDEIMGTTKEAPAEAGASEVLLERWLGSEPPPWALTLTSQIIDAVMALRGEALEEAARQQVRAAGQELRKQIHDARTLEDEGSSHSTPGGSGARRP